MTHCTCPDIRLAIEDDCPAHGLPEHHGVTGAMTHDLTSDIRLVVAWVLVHSTVDDYEIRQAADRLSREANWQEAVQPSDGSAGPVDAPVPAETPGGIPGEAPGPAVQHLAGSRACCPRCEGCGTISVQTGEGDDDWARIECPQCKGTMHVFDGGQADG